MSRFSREVSWSFEWSKSGRELGRECFRVNEEDTGSGLLGGTWGVILTDAGAFVSWGLFSVSLRDEMGHKAEDEPFLSFSEVSRSSCN